MVPRGKVVAQVADLGRVLMFADKLIRKRGQLSKSWPHIKHPSGKVTSLISREGVFIMNMWFKKPPAGRLMPKPKRCGAHHSEVARNERKPIRRGRASSSSSKRSFLPTRIPSQKHSFVFCVFECVGPNPHHHHTTTTTTPTPQDKGGNPLTPKREGETPQEEGRTNSHLEKEKPAPTTRRTGQTELQERWEGQPPTPRRRGQTPPPRIGRIKTHSKMQRNTRKHNKK